jgi:hypothetical protein
LTAIQRITMKETTAIKTIIEPSENAPSSGRLPAVTDCSESTEVTAPEKELLAEGIPGGSTFTAEDTGRKIALDHLINRLNFVNFQEGHIRLHFTHRRSGRSLLIPAFPLPCSCPVLECVWSQETDGTRLSQTHELKHLLVPRGERLIQSIPEVIEIHARGCRLALPSVSCEVSHRRIERQRCCGIAVHLIQNSSSFSGSLLDFTASSFRIELKELPPQRFDWIDPALPVQVIFHSGGRTLYSSECHILRTTPGRDTRGYVLEPLKQEIQRYRKAEFRSDRQVLNPSPNIIFRHPLTQKRADLKVIDLSGSGLAVEEDETASVLLPGLTLPEVELSFGNIFKIKCSLQVVFRKPSIRQLKRQRVRCGLALIDVAAQDHIKLLGILHQVKDKNAYICNEIDLEALWDFLFETGFIYPAKYALIEKNKGAVKATYAKLYQQSPEIARHFVYQDNGVILGHMATIRFWDRTWLIHHHAARKSALPKAGLVVLDQIGRFVHDTFRIRGLHMDYMVCYYRPQNRFPNRVFGGVARYINNPQSCSVDPFAYVRLEDPSEKAAALPAGWQVEEAEAEDLDALAASYERVSGGLLVKAMDLDPASGREERLGREFQNHGFQRARHLFALKQGGRLKAVIIVNVSDIGLNLSDLVHCLNALILEPENLPPEVLLSALQRALLVTGQHGIPALIFPLSYAEENGIPIDKVYHLWAFNIFEANSQAYYKYLSRLTKYV